MFPGERWRQGKGIGGGKPREKTPGKGRGSGEERAESGISGKVGIWYGKRGKRVRKTETSDTPI